MTKDEEQLIANIMHRMHVNEQARLDAALASARADAVARAEADRVRIEGLSEELRLERETCTETADLLNRESEKVRGLSVQAQDQRSEIERLRDEAAKYKTERDHFYQREGIEAKKRMDVEDERDGLLTQVQDMREEIIRVNDAHGQTLVERDALRAEVAALQEWLRALNAVVALHKFHEGLKSQTPKQHPVKVGEWVECVCAPGVGTKRQVLEVHADWYLVDVGHSWNFDFCIPCDPPKATHDTEAGKAVAESAVSETVADEIKVGDVVKVVGASGDLTAQSDIGKIGEVLQLDSMDGAVRLSGGAGWVNHRDVRKVTT